MRGLNHEGEDIFRWSVECLRKSPHAMEENHQRILAMCLTAQGQCMLALSQERTKALADESISILRHLPDGKETILSLKLLEALASDESERTNLAQKALDIARAGKSGWWLPKCMMDLGYFAINRGGYAEAKSLIQEARSVYRGTNNPALEVQALLMLHQIATLENDRGAARQFAEECLTVAQDTGYSAALWWLHSSIADYALLQGDYGTAQTHYEAGLALCQEMDERRGSVFELSGLGSAACGLGNYADACRYFHDALQLAKVVANIPATLDVIGGIAWLLADQGQTERALQFAAYVLSQPAVEAVAKARMTQLLQKLESILLPETYVAAIEDGKRIDLDDTIIMLPGELNHRLQETHTPIIAPLLPDPLTERELEVLRLVADGLSNYDIAVQLFVGMSTVKTHVNRILSKLCVKNRTQAGARARELRLL